MPTPCCLATATSQNVLKSDMSVLPACCFVLYFAWVFRIFWGYLQTLKICRVYGCVYIFIRLFIHCVHSSMGPGAPLCWWEGQSFWGRVSLVHFSATLHMRASGLVPIPHPAVGVLELQTWTTVAAFYAFNHVCLCVFCLYRCRHKHVEVRKTTFWETILSLHQVQVGEQTQVVTWLQHLVPTDPSLVPILVFFHGSQG